jgi:hypothetical protein
MPPTPYPRLHALPLRLSTPHPPRNPKIHHPHPSHPMHFRHPHTPRQNRCTQPLSRKQSRRRASQATRRWTPTRHNVRYMFIRIYMYMDLTPHTYPSATRRAHTLYVQHQLQIRRPQTKHQRHQYSPFKYYGSGGDETLCERPQLVRVRDGGGEEGGRRPRSYARGMKAGRLSNSSLL